MAKAAWLLRCTGTLSVVALLPTALSSLLFALLPFSPHMSISLLQPTNEQEKYRHIEVTASGHYIQGSGVHVVQKSSDGGAECCPLGLCHMPGGMDVSWRGPLPWSSLQEWLKTSLTAAAPVLQRICDCEYLGAIWHDEIIVTKMYFQGLFMRVSITGGDAQL